MSELSQAVALALEGFEREFVASMDEALLAAVLRTVHEPWSVPGREHLHAALMAATDAELHATAREVVA
jgi:hypothetical protein